MQPKLFGHNLSGGQVVESDFTVLRSKLAAACRKRNVSHDPQSRAAVDLHFAGVRALDIYRLARIADELDVSVDWLLGRTDAMELPEAKRKASLANWRATSTKYTRLPS